MIAVYILLALVGWIVLYTITRIVDIKLTNYLKYRREQLFLKSVRLRFPDTEDIELISIATNSKDALTNIERRLREHY